MSACPSHRATYSSVCGAPHDPITRCDPQVCRVCLNGIVIFACFRAHVFHSASYLCRYPVVD